MRVTNNITTKQFLRNNNMALTNMLRSENRIETQRRFNRVSEETINGGRAMIIRRQLKDLDIYKENLSSSKALFSAAEVNLISVTHDDYISVEEKLVAATNGTWDQMELDIYAKELDEIAENMVFTLNNDFSERQLFGGASNGATPFRIERVVIKDDGGNVVFPPDYEKYYDDNGVKDGVNLGDVPKVVTYNGIPLDFDITSKMILADGTVQDPPKADANGNIVDSNGNPYTIPQYTVTYLDSETKKWGTDTQDIDTKNVENAIKKNNNALMYPGSLPIYVDIGLGIKYNENYEVDPQTALDISMNGAEITGNGIDVSKSKVSFDYTSKSIDLAKNFPSSVQIKINSTTLTLDLSAGFTESVDPKENDVNITKALNDALDNAITAAGNPSDLPNGLSLKYSDGSITISSDSGNFTAESSDLGIAQGSSQIEVTDRYSKNLIQLVLDSAAALRRGDQKTTNAIIDRANEANSHILKQITTLGTKQTTIEFYMQRNEDYKIALQERQNIVEGTDMEDEITRYEAIKAAYDATLKMGSQILPHSIFDFI